MIVDSSAILAILNGEPDAELYDEKIALAENCRISAANLLETAIVTESRGGLDAGNELDLFLENADIEVAPVTSSQVSTADAPGVVSAKADIEPH